MDKCVDTGERFLYIFFFMKRQVGKIDIKKKKRRYLVSKAKTVGLSSAKWSVELFFFLPVLMENKTLRQIRNLKHSHPKDAVVVFLSQNRLFTSFAFAGQTFVLFLDFEGKKEEKALPVKKKKKKKIVLSV